MLLKPKSAYLSDQGLKTVLPRQIQYSYMYLHEGRVVFQYTQGGNETPIFVTVTPLHLVAQYLGLLPPSLPMVPR